MTRAPFRILVPVTISVIACGYLFSRADDPHAAEKLRNQQGLTGAAVSVHLKSGKTVYHIEHAIIKSLGGQTFLTGNLLLIREPNSQRPPDKRCRTWVPHNEVQAILEYQDSPFDNAKPAATNLGAPADGSR